MLTPEYDDHLLGLPVLHDDHSILEVEVKHYVLRGMYPESLKSLLLEFLPFDLCEHVEMLFVCF